MYDIIGDVHGYADKLESLLQKLGYKDDSGVYRHPSRVAIFLGDFIDRGPKIRETLHIVRPMIEAGSALAVMGNHELNLLAHLTPHPWKPGEYLRSAKKRYQIEKTEESLSSELPEWINWFRTLPLWLDLDGLRVVHACWDPASTARIGEGAAPHVTDDFLAEACLEEGTLHGAVEVLLKGKEAPLPHGLTFLDKHDEKRRDVRLRWYASPARHTYRTYSLGPEAVPCDMPLDAEIVRAAVPYPADDKPVFVGHYGLMADRPTLLARNVACVDWGVANDGPLCAYRWNGEQELDTERFAYA